MAADTLLDIESAARLAFAPAIPETALVTRTYPSHRRTSPGAVLVVLAMAVALIVAL